MTQRRFTIICSCGGTSKINPDGPSGVIETDGDISIVASRLSLVISCDMCGHTVEEDT